MVQYEFEVECSCLRGGVITIEIAGQNEIESITFTCDTCLKKEKEAKARNKQKAEDEEEELSDDEVTECDLHE
jgi:hypothetical protein